MSVSRGRQSQRHPLSTRPFRIFVACGLTITAVHAVPALGPLSDQAYGLLAVGGIVATAFGTMRNRPEPAGPWWIWIASAVLFAVGAVIRLEMGTTGDLTDDRPLLPELFTFPGYVLFAAAFVWMLRARSRQRDEPGVALDAALLGLGACVLAWVLLISPAVSRQDVPPTALAAIGVYPLISAFLVSIAARLAFMRGDRSLSHRMLLGGMATLLLGDVLYFFVEMNILHVPQGLLDLPYGITYTLLAGAALHPSMRMVATPEERESDQGVLRGSRILLIGGALILPAILTLIWAPTNPVERYGVPSIVVALAVVAIARVIVAAKAQARSEAKYAHLALYDELTGLPNRTSIHEFISKSWSRNDGRGLGMVYVDLDHFNRVNDSFGHPTGDRLLTTLADRLKALVRSSEFVGRISGDEFAIVVRGTLEDTLAVADRVRLAFQEPVDVGTEVVTTASIGVSHTSLVAGDDISAELVRGADTAMYRSKARGRNVTTLFDESMRERVARRLSLETQLRQALAANELEVFYQPIVALPNGETLGFEALVRWPTPDGWVAPVEFIPVAEESGLIFPLGAWVLDNSLGQLAKWRALPGFDQLSMSVNFSAHQVHSPDVVELVGSCLEKHRLPGSALWFEITESLMISDTPQTAATLNGLRDLGVGVCVDDFGTGFSSLAYLQNFPIDRLKIDRAFVSTITDEHADRHLVAGIAAIASTLGIDTVAEGVETFEQATALVIANCAMAQGYYFGRPEPAEAQHARLLSERSRMKRDGSSDRPAHPTLR